MSPRSPFGLVGPRLRLLAASLASASACGGAGNGDASGPTSGPQVTDTSSVTRDGSGPGDATSADTTADDGGADDAPLPDAGEAPPSDERGGLVRVEGGAFVDDGGPFLARGATMMWAAWAYKFDRPRLEANLAYLAEHRYHYIRALGVVGDPAAEDYWDGREIEMAWPDYPEVIAGLTDLAWDGYGLRVEWTLIGDGQITVPTPGDKEALVDAFVAMSQGREEKIIHFEIANEAWQNGFPGADGVVQLRALTSDLRSRTEILVAASAPPSSLDCGQIAEIYDGDVADIATIHFDRDTSQVDGFWRPVWQPWTYAACGGMPVATNNEPIGPGASVASEDDPERLAASAVATWISGVPAYVFHSHAGVRGDEDLATASGIDALGGLDDLLPPDLSAWTRRELGDPAAPFVVFAEENGTLMPDTTWPQLGAPQSGVVRALMVDSGTEFVMLAIGVLDHVVVEANATADIEVIALLEGAVLESRAVAAGEQLSLSGAGALLVRGTRQ